MGIARYYDEAKNPDGAQIFGVPLGDLTDEQFEALPPHIQRSVDAAGFYRKTKPRPERDEPTRRALPRRPGAERADAAEGEPPPHETDNPGDAPASTEEG